ncbi:MAG: NAD(P)H-hydrate epimerase [Candidatus Syntrophopropionicum ammoniitolerans]
MRSRYLLGEIKGRSIAIFIGKGNNGGDGLVIARHLLNRGVRVKVLSIVAAGEIRGDAAVNLDIWRKMGQKIYPIHQDDGINIVKLALVKTDLIVDAIFGTGFHGPMKKEARPCDPGD